MKSFSTFLLILLLAVNFCRAQEKTVDAKQILQKSADACLKIKTIEFTEEQYHSDHEDKKPFLTATVRQGRADVPLMGFVPGKFIVEGQTNSSDGLPNKFAYSYDGAAFRVLEVAEKTIQVVKSPTPYIAGQVLSGTGLVGIPQFTQAEPFKVFLDEGENFVYEGKQTINGVECDVISFSRTINHPTLGKIPSVSRWFIGREDNLPRGNEIGNTRKTIKNLKVNNQDAPTDYFIPIQDGYSEKLITGKEPKGKGLLALGSTAPEWKLIDGKGKSHSLSEYLGKVVVLDFWGTWCVPCWKSMPGIQSLHDKFKDRGVVVFGISVNDKELDPVEFMKRKGYTYNVLLGGDAVSELYKAEQLPTLYVIGTDGKIIHAEYGYRKDATDELISIIEKYLKIQKK